MLKDYKSVLGVILILFLGIPISIADNNQKGQDFHCNHFSKTGDTICFDDLSGNEIAKSPGYSGQPGFENHPEYDFLHNLGPIPEGTYKMTGVSQNLNGKSHADVIQLAPMAETQTYKRSQFRIHGDYTGYRAGSASNGCVIATPQLRRTIAERLNNGAQGVLFVYPMYPQNFQH